MEEPACRITRARAKALGTASRQIQKPPRNVQKRVLKAKSKRATADENELPNASAVVPQNKRRAVLTDVTNFLCERSQMSCFNVAKTQASKQGKRGPLIRNSKVAPNVSAPAIIAEERKKDAREIIAKDVSIRTYRHPEVTALTKVNTAAASSNQILEPHARSSAAKFEEDLSAQAGVNASKDLRGSHVAKSKHFGIFRKVPIHLCGLFRRDEEICENLEKLKGIMDIDSNQKDPQMCSIYASDIYVNKCVTELNQRPLNDYMETVQRDITQSMRGILIDWLVEVSEEYKLVPDTLYLTINLIDRFLSRNFIEKQRLQLLGVTCMLIASKYEEICPPRIEEFCFITDNTYTREEVVKMESEVLNLLCFRLSVPTTKTFLRRYLLATKVSYEAFSVDLEFLANYLAEITLVEYSFLKYLPSLIAASAVFLARWTLDQSVHPWNPTLEYYTRYKAPDLKITVLALEELQSNSKNCSLKAIRVKYQQDKFNCVADLSSLRPVQSLF